MVDALDMLQCPICDTWYKPRITSTGRTVPHCLKLYAPHINIGHGQIVEREAGGVKWLDGEVWVDWTALERQMIESYRLTAVVDPLLTGMILDKEV